MSLGKSNFSGFSAYSSRTIPEYQKKAKRKIPTRHRGSQVLRNVRNEIKALAAAAQ